MKATKFTHLVVLKRKCGLRKKNNHLAPILIFFFNLKFLHQKKIATRLQLKLKVKINPDTKYF